MNRLYQIVNNLSHQAGAHAFESAPISSTTTTASRFRASVRGSYSFSSLAELPRRRLQQRRLHPDVRRHRGVADEPEPRRLRAGRVEDQSARDPESRSCATTCSSWTRSTRTRTTFAARWVSPGRRSMSRRTVVRGSAGLFYDRVPLRALANALLSAGNTTDLDQPPPDQRQPVADASGRAGVPEHPGSVVPSVTLVEPDDDGPQPAERLLAAGESGSRAATRASAPRSASAISTCAASIC